MKTILVPTDFSEYALNALKVAAQLARKTEAKIILAHVNVILMTEFAANIYYQEYYEQIVSQTEKRLDDLAKMEFLKGIKLSWHFGTNMPIWKLVCDDFFKDVDLIVVGSHGESGFNEDFLGSNTEKIIRMADIPVLTIKDIPAEFNIRSVVFASDFRDESYPAFSRIKAFADLYQSHIFLLKIIPPKEFEPTPVSRKMLNSFAKKFRLKKYSVNIYNAHSIETGIIDFSHEKDADLIAIETHGRTGLAHLINGSVAEGIARHESKPVLSIKIPTIHKSASKPATQLTDYKNYGNE